LCLDKLLLWAKLLVAKFNELFEHKNNDYFVQAKIFLTTAYNSKRGKVKVSVVNFARKLDNNDESSMTKFYEYYKKPRMQDIELFAKGEIKIRAAFLSVISIRQVHIEHDPDASNDQHLLRSSCTCPDYFNYKVCLYSIACLIHMNVTVVLCSI